MVIMRGDVLSQNIQRERTFIIGYETIIERKGLA